MKDTAKKTIEDIVESRIKNPFWSAFILSFILINWQLIVYSIFEFNTMNFEKFEKHLKGDFDCWFLIPLGVGVVNLLFGQAAIEFCKAISSKIHNWTTKFYIKMLNETVMTVVKHNELTSEYQQKIHSLEEDIQLISGDLSSKIDLMQDMVNDRESSIADLEDKLSKQSTFNEIARDKLSLILDHLYETLSTLDDPANVSRKLKKINVELTTLIDDYPTTINKKII